MKNVQMAHDARLQLICLVHAAHEDLRAMMQNRSRSRKAKVAKAAARQRFSVLNRALAVIALDAAS